LSVEIEDGRTLEQLRGAIEHLGQMIDLIAFKYPELPIRAVQERSANRPKKKPRNENQMTFNLRNVSGPEPDFLIPDYWSTEQGCAIYGMLVDLQLQVWLQYQLSGLGLRRSKLGMCPYANLDDDSAIPF